MSSICAFAALVDFSVLAILTHVAVACEVASYVPYNIVSEGLMDMFIVSNISVLSIPGTQFIHQ